MENKTKNNTRSHKEIIKDIFAFTETPEEISRMALLLEELDNFHFNRAHELVEILMDSVNKRLNPGDLI